MCGLDIFQERIHQSIQSMSHRFERLKVQNEDMTFGPDT